MIKMKAYTLVNNQVSLKYQNLMCVECRYTTSGPSQMWVRVVYAGSKQPYMALFA